MARKPARLLVAAALVLATATLLLASGGCATGSLPSFLSLRDRGDEPWEIPETAYPTQRLYRVRYDGPDGRIGFKLTLYLENAQVFRMRAADSLGRKVWDLAVDETDRALWLDHRNKLYCEARGAGHLALVPLANLPLASLPKLLLGRLPSEPASGLLRSPTAFQYLDARGQQWSGAFLEDGSLSFWTLYEESEAVSWWRRENGESVFVDLRGSLQLHWRELVREPLASKPKAVQVPERYREAACGG